MCKACIRLVTLMVVGQAGEYLACEALDDAMPQDFLARQGTLMV